VRFATFVILPSCGLQQLGSYTHLLGWSRRPNYRSFILPIVPGMRGLNRPSKIDAFGPPNEDVECRLGYVAG